MEKIFYTLAIGAFGGYLGLKFKIPAGALIGSMFAVGLFNIFTSKGYIPTNFKIAGQIVIGSIIGLNFTMDSIKGLKDLILPALLLVFGLTLVSILLGIAIHKITGLDLTTALFSTAPGGLADMTIMSESFGAQTHIVALLHLVRLFTVLTVLPMVIGWLTKAIVAFNS